MAPSPRRCATSRSAAARRSPRCGSRCRSRTWRRSSPRSRLGSARAPGSPCSITSPPAARWCCRWRSSRGCGFLWAPAAMQAELHPLAISHGYGAGFLAEFDWTGTRDPTPFLCVPAGIACHARFGGAALMARNQRLALEAARLLAARWGTQIGGPEDAFAAIIIAQAGSLWVRIAAQAYNELADYERLAAVL